MEKERIRLTNEQAFFIMQGVAKQAVKDAGSYLRRIYKRPTDVEAWNELYNDIVPYFKSAYCPIDARVLMTMTIEQEMDNKKLTEMPNCWKKVLAMVA